MISEDSMRDRKQRNKSAINQVLKMRLMTAEPLEKVLPERKRGKYPGTTKGNVVGYIGLSPNSEIWRATVEEKTAMYGNRVIARMLQRPMTMRKAAVRSSSLESHQT